MLLEIGAFSRIPGAAMTSVLHAFLAETAEAQPQSLTNMVIPLVLMGVVFYFLLIRPQQKQAKEHQKLLTGLKKADEVVTQGGMLGTVVQVEDRTVTLDVGGGTKVRVLKANIIGPWVEKPVTAPAKPEKK
jgi:preprotein translocase subunit YajC